MISEERIWEVKQKHHYRGQYNEEMFDFVTFARAIEAEVRKEYEPIVSTIDEAMVVSHLGVFAIGDDPKSALNKLLAWSESVGAYFAEAKIKRLEQELFEEVRRADNAQQERRELTLRIKQLEGAATSWFEKYEMKARQVIEIGNELTTANALIEQAREALAAMVMEARARDCGLRIADEALAAIERHQKGGAK